jgi:hypothetical protein
LLLLARENLTEKQYDVTIPFSASIYLLPVVQKQEISMGNIFKTRMFEIFKSYFGLAI